MALTQLPFAPLTSTALSDDAHDPALIFLASFLSFDFKRMEGKRRPIV